MSQETFVPVLQTLSLILDKASHHAESKKIDPAVLVNARLAPDMFPLKQQVQIACEMAKACMARLSGAEPPARDDMGESFAELKQRIESAIGYVQSLGEASFEGAADRAIAFPLIDKLVYESNGLQFLRDWTLPHFYFHVVTVYDILRHNGVELSKRDYMSHVSYAMRERG
jgi:hypothetical protein